MAIRFFAMSVVLSLLMALPQWVTAEEAKPQETSPQETAAREPSGLEFAASIEQSLEAAIARAEKSVVAISRVKRNREGNELQLSDIRLAPFGGPVVSPANSDPTDSDFVPAEYGTGVVIDPSGLILTNYHVLGDGDDLEACDYFVTGYDRKVRVARIKAADPRSDLAVLAVEARDLPAITFGDGGKLKKGQIVIALGNPYAIARDGQASASWGIISNLQRKAGRAPEESNPSGKSTLHHLGTLIQTDAKLNLGTSGGALLNLRGEMVGLTTSLAAAAGYEQAAGYAVPVDETFKRVIDRLKNGEEPEYGFLGVQPGNLLPEMREGNEHGVLVQDVVHGTPADRFGIQRGDIITHVNGNPIFDFDGLVLQVGSQAAGEQVELAIDRSGRMVPVKLVLAKYRVQGKSIATNRPSAWRGARVDFWTAVVDFRLEREQLAPVDHDGCVVVTEVEPESLAARAGLKPGMAITHVADAQVTTPQEFRAAVESLMGAVKLRIVGATVDDRTELTIDAE